MADDVLDLAIDPLALQHDDSIVGILNEDGIEGLDYDVIVSLLLTLIIGFVVIGRFLTTLYRNQFWNRGGNGIHPDHAANVNGFRETEEQRIQRQAATRRRIEEAKLQTNHECPICLGSTSFSVLTDCGHVFCCRCIIGYWQHSKPIVKPVDCAICRTTIHMLLPLQWPTHNEEANENDVSNDLLHENNIRINDYNRRFSNSRPVLDYIRDVPVLIPYLLRNFMNNDLFTMVYQVRVAVIIFTVVLYFLTPMDIVPESIYGLVGFFDDCLISAIVIGYLIRFFRDHMAQRGMAGNYNNVQGPMIIPDENEEDNENEDEEIPLVDELD